jgi:hypothetical protein
MTLFFAVFTLFGQETRPADADGGTLSARLGNGTWREGFETALHARLREDKVPEATLRRVYRMLGDSQLREDPLLAAESVAGYARAFDADLRRGVPAVSAMAAYRQSRQNREKENQGMSGEEKSEMNSAAFKEMRDRLKDGGPRNVRAIEKKTKPVHPANSGKDNPGKNAGDRPGGKE